MHINNIDYILRVMEKDISIDGYVDKKIIRSGQGYFNSLWLFFISDKVTTKDLELIRTKAIDICNSKEVVYFGGCECLDKREIIETYGLKVLILS